MDVDRFRTKQFCETSFDLEVDNITNAAILQDILPKNKVVNIKNEAILRDSLQSWKVECWADSLVPFSIPSL